MSLLVSRVSYLSKYVRVIPTRIAIRYLSSPASSPPPAEGFEVVWQRAAAMIVALTERQPSKILHVYPCENFTKYLSEHSIFDVEGLAENDSNKVIEEDSKPLPHYSNVHITSKPINSSLETELRVGSYHVVMQCLSGPDSTTDSSRTTTTATKQGLAVQELIRVVASRGYLILGAPAAEFDRLGYQQELLGLSEDGSRSPFRGSLISVQKLAIGTNNNINSNNNPTSTAASTITSTEKSNSAADILARRKAIGHSNSNGNSSSEIDQSDMYKIALFRKQ